MLGMLVLLQLAVSLYELSMEHRVSIAVAGTHGTAWSQQQLVRSHSSTSTSAALALVAGFLGLLGYVLGWF